MRRSSAAASVTDDNHTFCATGTAMYVACRSSTSIRRHYKLSYILFLALLHTTLSSCRPLLRHFATNARVCCGVSYAKDFDVLSVVSRLMRSAKICSTPTVYNVSCLILTASTVNSSPISEVRGYISADKCYADIRNSWRISIGYGWRFVPTQLLCNTQCITYDF